MRWWGLCTWHQAWTITCAEQMLTNATGYIRERWSREKHSERGVWGGTTRPASMSSHHTSQTCIYGSLFTFENFPPQILVFWTLQHICNDQHMLESTSGFTYLYILSPARLGFSPGSDGKESACNAGDLGLIPGSGRSPGEETGYPLQYSCLENSMDGGAWWATVHVVTESDMTKWLILSPFRL